MGRRLGFFGLFVLLAVAAAFVLHRWIPPAPRFDKPVPQPRGGRVYFLPVGKLQRVSPDHLSRHFGQKFGFQVTLLPELTPAPEAFNAKRNQFSSEKLIEQINRAHPEIVKDQTSVLIAFTDADIYIEKMAWKFSYAYRDGLSGIVSSAWMDPPTYGDPANPELCRVRFRKMVTKYIGILYYRLPQSRDPRSVLFARILGETDLDAMGEEF